MSIISGTQPRYRYHEVAPESITVPVRDLLARLPAEYRARKEGEDQDEAESRTIDLPCREVFKGNSPRLPLGLLHDLLPDVIDLPGKADRAQRLPLPAGWLALHFRLMTKREELPPEPVATPDLCEESPREADQESGLEARPSIVEEKAGEVRVETSASRGNEDAPAPQPVSEVPPIARPAELMSRVQAASESLLEKTRGFLGALPIFRHYSPSGEPPVQESIPASTAPSNDLIPATLSRELPQAPATQLSVKQPESGTALTLERLWKLDPHDQFADPAALQTLFMTDEKLTLERVIALSGQLPGLKACVLAAGDQVVCASATPAGLDLRALSSHAMKLLAQLRDSSAKMGLGSVPAITLHADQGVVSFLHQGELCLLVLHADRGFVPGVRERLQEMLGHLSSAKALSGGSPEKPSLQH